MSTVYIRKIGTELGVIIPSNIVDEKKIKLGDWYGINLQEDGSIVLSPIEDVSISNVRQCDQNAT
ncbi:hypothetical protein PASE110613_02635 [Paenibacillus sediminis]|uniref:Antitoxin component of MazEF toxin-antitoxin module n=1 Tax=Paenibacillus sediminis TaxID=664909 RepID=A0ABS4H071_9BACL|nr:antitoxin component of MazEF toxin-antitoxin module [Paenibacillus sediminis]